jgi:hypothetical protein
MAIPTPIPSFPVLQTPHNPVALKFLPCNAVVEQEFFYGQISSVSDSCATLLIRENLAYRMMFTKPIHDFDRIGINQFYAATIGGKDPVHVLQ